MNPARLIAPPGLFRLMLAAIVVINHSVPVYFGPAAVYLFFMLSGYWVTVMWRREYAPGRRPTSTFLISRLWRLLPVYYVALVLFIAGDRFFPAETSLAHWPGGWGGLHFALSHLFILGYASQPFAQKLLLPVWSLDIELQFYLVAPLLILLLQSTTPTSLRRLALLATAAIGFAAFLRFYATVLDQSGGWLPMYLLFFLIGLHTAHGEWKPGPRLAVSGLLAALALAACCMAWPQTRSLFIGLNSGWLSDYNPHANILLALLCAPYAMATLRKLPSRESWIGRHDRDFGNITYEIYLLHWPVLSVMEHFVGHVHRLRQMPALLAAWAALVPLCWTVYRCIDQPSEQYRKAFVLRRQSVRPEAGPLPAGRLAKSVAH